MPVYHERAVANLKDMTSWTEHLGRSKLRSFTDDEGHFWLEQNSAKASKWAKLARQGHDVAWELTDNRDTRRNLAPVAAPRHWPGAPIITPCYAEISL